MRFKTKVLGWTLIWSGIFLLGYVAWQLYGTDVVNARVQAQEREVLIAAFEESDEPAPFTLVDPAQTGPVKRFDEAAPESGAGFALMRVPRVGLEAVVFEGVTRTVLKDGPGHLPDTAVPGQPGNSVISGHRTTYGRPFHDFDLLTPGDRVEVETGIGIHVYEVRESFIVEPTAIWVTEPKPGAWLTLTTCHPKFSARERLIVTAELVDGPNMEYVNAVEEVLSRVS